MQAARGASLNPSDPTHSTADEPVDPGRAAGTRARCLMLFAGVAVVGYVADVVSKVVAVAELTDRPPVPVLGNVLTLSLARNPGAAFSTGTSFTLALTCVALGAVVAVLVFARRLGSVGWAIALGFLLAGVLGNLTDRIFRSPAPFRGHVVDFLQLPHWPIFNVADMCINVAAVLIVVQALRGVTLTGFRSRPPRTSDLPSHPSDPSASP